MENLVAYVPADRRYALAAGKELPDRTQGAALFADISGFTPLSEALAESLGPQRGAEELTRHLNLVYTALIGELDRFSGSVTGFSGDAITCWFEGDTGLRATACALKMQRAMDQFAAVALPSGGRVALAMKAAVAMGPVRRFLVGDPELHVIDVLAGRTLDELAEAEHHAEKGEVVLATSTVEALGKSVEITRRPDESGTGRRCGLVRRLRKQLAPAPSAPLPLDALSEEQLRPWLLPPVYERLRAGQGEFLAELRPAVALFMQFEGIAYDDDPAAGEKLDGLIRIAQRVLANYEGTLIDLTMGDKGSHLYAAFGAPVAHEDDAERAAFAALDLRDEARQLPYIESVRIGINRGRMRTGAYGGPTRRTYGVLGDATNLAARLMVAAEPDQILVSLPTIKAIEAPLAWHDHPDLRVKGKAEPVGVKVLVGREEAPALPFLGGRMALPMVGRDGELNMIQEKIRETLLGRGQIVRISAEAGMGKSRLMLETLEVARQVGMTTHFGECKSFGTSASYLVWSSIWQTLFRMQLAQPAEKQVRHLEQQLRQISLPLVARLPLLNPVLNLRVPDNDLTSSFDAKLRKSSLEALLLECLRSVASNSPVILALEDVHWIDPLSLDLLLALSRAAARWRVMFLLSARLEGAEGMEVQELRNFTEIPLSSLADDQATQLVALKTAELFGAGAKPPQPFVERLVGRAEGNPFYIEQLLTYLKNQDIRLEDAGALDQLDLPASLHSLVLTRIDRLQDRPRSALRLASMMGRSFNGRDLWGAYPQLGGERQAKESFAELERQGFTLLESPIDPSYYFRHSVIQEVAYSSLPFETRAAFHDTIGQYLESTYVDSLDQQLDVLALHFDRSSNEPKKREYLLKAGEAAQSDYANSAAIDYYRKLLPLLPVEQQLELMLKLGEVLELVGQWTEVEELYTQALEKARGTGDRSQQAQVQAALGELYRKQGQYELAKEWLEQARSSFQELNDDGQLAQVLRHAGTLAAQQGDYEAAGQFFEKSLAIRKRLGNHRAVSKLLINLGVIARYKGELERALGLYEQSLTISRGLGDKWSSAISLNNQGNLFVDLGDYEGAERRLEEAVNVMREVGDRWYYANAVNNLGNVARAAGRYQQARTLYTESLRINQELGDRWALAYLLEDVGYLNAAEGRAEEALKLIGAGAALREAVGAPLPPHEQGNREKLLEPARRALPSEAQEAALDFGRKLSLEQALEFALREPAGRA